MLAVLTTFLAPFRRVVPEPRPMLLRVTDDPSLRSIELDVRWATAGGERRASARLQVSDGMVLLGWADDARACEVHAPSGSVVVRKDAYAGGVVELA